MACPRPEGGGEKVNSFPAVSFWGLLLRCPPHWPSQHCRKTDAKQLRWTMKHLISSTIAISIFLTNICHAVELSKLAGKFQLRSSRSSSEDKQIEIIYYNNFRFEGVNESFEALKFGGLYISIIKDSRGTSQLCAQKLETVDPDMFKVMEATESQCSISSQPNSYTRMLLMVEGESDFCISYSYKLGTIHVGPHVSLFPRWQKNPNHIMRFTRIP